MFSALHAPSSNRGNGRRAPLWAGLVAVIAIGGAALATSGLRKHRDGTAVDGPPSVSDAPNATTPHDGPFTLPPMDLGIRPRVAWSSDVSKQLPALIPKGAEVGLYVEDLQSGRVFTWDADRPMYLGSAIKIFVMIEAHRQREEGLLNFDEKLWYRRDDVRDGAPAMNRLRRNRQYPISELLLYMMRDSDNAATDILFKRLTPDAVEATMHELGATPPGGVVNMMDVRREVYRRLDPRADRLDAVQVRDVRWRNGFYPRLDLLKKHIGPPAKDFDREDLDRAYRDYYRQQRNAISMRQAGAVLADLYRGEVVSSTASAEMIGALKDVWSSGHRLRGVVDDSVPVAHKTGTQHKRICDLAIVWLDSGPVVVAVAVANLPRLKAEETLRAVVGAVIGASGGPLKPDVNALLRKRAARAKRKAQAQRKTVARRQRANP